MSNALSYRFSFIQHLERTVLKTATAAERINIIKNVSMAMLTSPEEWDTYANRRSWADDIDDTVASLRDGNYLA